MNTIKLRKPGKKVFKETKPKLTLVPPAETSADAVGQVELSPEEKEMLREMQQQRRARRDSSDAPEAA